MTSVTIGGGVTTIGWQTFESCTSLSSITIPEGVTSIGGSAFYGCSSLTSITIPNSVTSIEGGTFEDCTSLSSITIPKGVTSIGSSAFKGCSSLTSIAIPDSVTSIGEWAFSNCTGLTPITIPNGVDNIGVGAFNRMFYIAYKGTASGSPWGARSVNGYLENYLVYADTTKNVLLGCNPATKGKITIPHSVTSLGSEAFRYCDGIDTLIIGNGITDIDDQFEDCGGITYLQLGSGVKTIAHNAFYDAKKLKRIVCYALEPPVAQVQDGWSNGSFYNYNIHVQVPCDNLEDYETDAVWGSFKYLECVGAEKTETNGKVLVTPRDNDADITWPTNSSADTYTILITQDGTEICTLVFNSDGQLTRIAFAAPARNGEQRHTPSALLTQDGYRFTVTGLSSGTQYAYAINVKDAKSNVLNTYKGSFTTTGGATGMDDIPATGKTLDATTPRKVFRDGQVYILRGGKTYTATGVEVE